MQSVHQTAGTKRYRRLCAGLAALALGGFWAVAQAQHSHASHGTPATQGAAPSAPGAADWAEGEIRRIDAASGRVTLRHGEIRNLDMPPMTMVFQLRDAAPLGALKTGDKVRFKAVAEGGKYVVTDIEQRP